MKIQDSLELAIVQLKRKPKLVLFLVTTVMVLTTVVAISLSASTAMRRHMNRQVAESGMNCVRVEAARDAEPLNVTQLHRLENSDGVAKVIASLRGVVHFANQSGGWKPAYCSSFVAEDVTMGATVLLSGSVERVQSPSLVVSPAFLERYGFGNQTPAVIRGYVVQDDHDGHPRKKEIKFKVVAIVGDLGGHGVRIDLPTFAGIKAYQQGQDLALDTNLESLLRRQQEIDSFQVIAVSHEVHVIRELHEQIESDGTMRCSSSFYEAGDDHTTMIAIATTITPIVVVIGIVVLWSISSSFGGSVRSEQALVSYWRSAGATTGDIMIMYLVQLILISVVGCLCGLAFAWVLVSAASGDLSERLEVELFASVPCLESLLVVSLVVLISGLIPAWWSTRVEIDEGIRGAGVIG